MSDIRKALRQAGLVSDKNIRQAKHKDRVHRKEVGSAGLAAEREAKEAAHRAEQARRKQADTALEEKRREQQEIAGQQTRLESLLRTRDISAQEAGPRRFYFELADGRISFVDVSVALVRRLAQGDVAIVDGDGILDRQFALITGKTAHELEALDPSRIIHWNVRR